MRTTKEITADAQPFNDRLIEEIPAGGGRTASYVSWKHYAQRLLLVHGAHRYTVTSVTHGRQVTETRDGPKETYIWAVGVRVQFSDDEWYDAVGEGDTPTSAESNGYKRACAHAGIGLHLYGDYWLVGQLEKAVSAGFSQEIQGDPAAV